jgi:hypothetical protein
MKSTEQIIKKKSLLVADKEHFTKEIFGTTNKHSNFDLLTPMLNNSRTKSIVRSLTYTPLWAGFAITETTFNFNEDHTQYRLIAQRTGENPNDYQYNAFLTTDWETKSEKLICENYNDRWSVEEFFHFENEMGLNRASTLNLNIRYGMMALAMMAKAATYQLRSNLLEEYKKWNAKHLANEMLAWTDGDIRVNKDTIIVTFYNCSKHIDVDKYKNLPKILSKEGISTKIPWLYNFKLDFRFK